MYILGANMYIFGCYYVHFRC